MNEEANNLIATITLVELETELLKEKQQGQVIPDIVFEVISRVKKNYKLKRLSYENEK